MKIARFETAAGAVRIGVARGDGLVDIARAGSAHGRVLDIVAAGPEGLARLADQVAAAPVHHPLSEVRLLAPIERPGKYLGIGMNYRKHAEEVARIVEAPKRQLWFNKQTSCIVGPHHDIDLGVSEQVDYEVELGVVIGRPAKGVKAASAKDYVFGYFVANDVSARDWQFHSQTFTLGKSFDTHGPIGPWIVTADEIADPHDLDLRCLVNGEARQASNTSQMIYNIFEQIEYLSTAFTLDPGDLLATGTPEGVGVGKEPPVFLRPGDVVRCEVDGIGVIENKVVRSAD